jgi:hypothetical protein
MQMTNKIEWPGGSMEAEPVDRDGLDDFGSIRGPIAPITRRASAFSAWTWLPLLSFPMQILEDRLAEREFRSGEGLWLNPFHGIPMTGLISPLDLIYLDEECRVIEAVESYPTFLASPSRPRAQAFWFFPRTRSTPRRPRPAISLCCASPKRWKFAWSGSQNGLQRRRTISWTCKARFCSESSRFGAEVPGLLELGTRSEQDAGKNASDA